MCFFCALLKSCLTESQGCLKTTSVLRWKKLITKKKKIIPKITDLTIKTSQVMWQLPVQKDISEITQLVAQPARFSHAFKNSHSGSCGK